MTTVDDLQEVNKSILGTIGTNNSIVVVEKTSSSVEQIKVSPSVGVDELLTYDAATKTLRGTGVTAKDGKLQTDSSSIFIGSQRISSGGHDLYIEDLYDQVPNRIISQVLARTGDATPTCYVLDPLTVENAQPIFTNIITDPDYQITIQHEEFLYGVHLKVASPINHLIGVNYVNIGGEWREYYRAEFIGNIPAGDFEFKFDADGHAPLSQPKGAVIRSKLFSPNGPVKLYGDSNGFPYFTLDVRHWTKHAIVDSTDPGLGHYFQDTTENYKWGDQSAVNAPNVPATVSIRPFDGTKSKITHAYARVTGIDSGQATISVVNLDTLEHYGTNTMSIDSSGETLLTCATTSSPDALINLAILVSKTATPIAYVESTTILGGDK